ncbi:MAG: MerR family transcriptional regulator [Actinobacteria bacterium]|nr:MerR family transcriptional regulator [Actinomycetota bacterium]
MNGAMEDGAKPSSTATAEHEPDQGAERPLTIGQVVASLESEFPDLSITKIRYLEDRGLLAPARSKGRYRKFTAADMRRLRTILTLQRDEYLPLGVIRDRLDRAEASGTGEGLASVVSPLRSNATLHKEEPGYTWADLCREAEVSEDFLRILIDYRLIEPSRQTGTAFTEGDVEIARICHVLARFGVEPRNLRLLGSSVEREAAILQQVVAPSLRSTHADKREYGEQLLNDLGGLYSRLMHHLLYKELRKAF